MNVEQKYGKLTVIREVERPVGKNYGRKWVLARCECGNEITTVLDKMRYGQIISCGCLCRRRGADNPYWKGYGEISADLFSTYKRHARGGGILNRKEKEFSVTLKYLWELFLKQNRKCSISGIDLSFDYKGDRLSWKKKETCKITASLDRIDSSKGYVEGNVQWIHKHINIMKNDLPQEKFFEYCRQIARKNP